MAMFLVQSVTVIPQKMRMKGVGCGGRGWALSGTNIKIDRLYGKQDDGH